MARDGALDLLLAGALLWIDRRFKVGPDENGFQAMGRTDEIIGLGDLAAKFATFGFDAVSIDGHDEAVIDETLAAADRAMAVVARA